MKKIIVGLLMMVLLLSGCGAGATHDLLAYDNIITAALMAKKGVEGFNTTVIADTAYRQGEMIKSVGTGVKKLAQDEDIETEAAEKLAQEVMTSLTIHLANYTEQERRRVKLYEVTIDNLNYIIYVSEQGKKYTIYKADLSQQWKDWLQSSAQDYIGNVK